MATTTSLLSWKEFEQLPDDGTHKEILAGELIILPPPKFRHSRIATRLFRALHPLMDQGLGEVYLGAGYKLSESPPSWIQPDVSFLSKARIKATDEDGYIHGSPDLAIEVISPSEAARDIERTTEALLSGGSLDVWIIYPESRHVHVFKPGGTDVLRRHDQILTLPEILPGFELPLSEIFGR